ncbi:hypothetical protein [Mycolicibacterium mengxianglii]|uniref:hypothetical protein n=1 Tax=Mycolicibacterium mengxianglii TaxID=2736649 RepID=UPI0018EF1842|nr:hypothetical protein [Mycolicibacterium mengxianglii]
MTFRGPIVSLAAVAVAGAGLWLANISEDPGRGLEVVSAPAAATTASPKPGPVNQFPDTATYSADIPTKGATIVVDLTVTEDTARAYVCDGAAIETWLSGPVTGDSVHLTGPGGQLDGRLQGRTVAGTLALGDRSWNFSAPETVDAQ